jgi:hypothetical protein
MATQLTSIEGTVERVNEKGFKLAGEERWRNWSRYANAPSNPRVGDHVRASVDDRDFVRAIEILEAPKLATPAPASARGPAAPEPADSSPSAATRPSIPQDDRGVVITRMNVLSTATAILSSGGRVVDPAEVLALAAELEAWVVRA